MTVIDTLIAALPADPSWAIATVLGWWLVTCVVVVTFLKVLAVIEGRLFPVKPRARLTITNDAPTRQFMTRVLMPGDAPVKRPGIGRLMVALVIVLGISAISAWVLATIIRQGN